MHKVKEPETSSLPVSSRCGIRVTLVKQRLRCSSKVDSKINTVNILARKLGIGLTS